MEKEKGKKRIKVKQEENRDKNTITFIDWENISHCIIHIVFNNDCYWHVPFWIVLLKSESPEYEL